MNVIGQTLGYVRMSTVDQNPAQQIEQLGKCQKIFQDTGSGQSPASRQGLYSLMTYVRDGDVVVVQSMDRLGRDTLDLYQILDELTRKGATVKLLSEGFTISRDETQPTQQLLLKVLAVIADFERAKIKERQAEGIAIAKAKGKYKQHPKLNETDLEQIHTLLEHGTSKTEIARQFQVSRQTVYNTLKRNLT